MKYLILHLFLWLSFLPLWAQDVPAPGPTQSETIILRNGTIHVGNGEIKTGFLVMEQGKITVVGKLEQTYKTAREIDLEGKHVYPGLILIDNNMGLIEIGQVRATRDQREIGQVNSNARALIAYNTDSKIAPTVRSNGVLMAQIAPSGGIFSGQSSVVQLDAWNFEDAAVRADDAVYLNWPNLRYRESRFALPIPVQQKRAQEQTDRIREVMQKAKAYMLEQASNRPMEHNQQLEALVPILKKEKKLFIRASSEKQIIEAIAFAREWDIEIVIVGGRDAYRQVDLLKRFDVPVVLTGTHILPSRPDEGVYSMYEQPQKLHAAGITFAITITSNWQGRNLPFQAGSAVAFGLEPEAAIQAITSHPAKILGIDDEYGTLAVGKSATLVVSEGDIMDMRNSQIIHAFIDGREVNLNNKQKDLYQKFLKKYQGK
ncbi:MAG: amidohydrolase family protein [Bacteroidota bacterium]